MQMYLPAQREMSLPTPEGAHAHIFKRQMCLHAPVGVYLG